MVCALLLSALLFACLPAVALADGRETSPVDPFGTGPQLTEDGRLFAWLYLPGLPSHPELITLYLERAWADEPNTWSLVYTFAWDEDWQEFAAVEDPFQTIRYYNYATGEDTPSVDYFEDQAPRRSFYLRARTVVLTPEGPLTGKPCAPVLFTVPGAAGPDDDEQGGESDEDTAGGADAGGGSGGDKGGIGQGEHERPAIEAPAILPSNEEEAPATGGASQPDGTPQPDDGSPAPADDETAAGALAPKATKSPTGTGAPAATIPQVAPTAPPIPPESESADEPAAPLRIPGIAAALGATGLLAAGAALAMRWRRRTP